MIGRKYEIERLEESLKSKESEFIAVYGRRRVGKTYLIWNLYEKHIKFEVTDLYGGNQEKQLDIFFDELKRVSSKLKEDTGTKDAIVLTMVTTYGVVEDENFHEVVENSYEMDILFENSFYE